MVTSLAIAVSFAAGLNTYAVLLALGLMGRAGWVVLPSGLESVTSYWVIAAAAVLFLAEFVADKIPGFDLAWNAAHTVVRIPVASLLAFGAARHLPPAQQILVTILGAVVASVAHGSKLGARILVTPSPEPVSNIGLSIGEDALAVALTWSALHAAIVTGAVVVGLMSCGVVLMVLAAKASNRLSRRLRKREYGRFRSRSPRLNGGVPTDVTLPAQAEYRDSSLRSE